ncbi:hypothetical protein CL618_03735 [archaeon]|nr:hypothetical protein [archaeon]|tara:strand:+ start:388 stop:699 length:312 start_codon:yes stop_codon:yes gene_type:complete
MDLESKTEKKTLGTEVRKEVTVVVKPLSQDEARERFPYRPYNKYSESRFGGNNMVDDFALLLNDLAERCGMCSAPTKKKYLDSYCPDCDGRSEYNGTDPRSLV